LCPPGAGLLSQYCGNPNSERSGCPTVKGSQRCKPKKRKKPRKPKSPKKHKQPKRSPTHRKRRTR
jgi:hypothetical protein